MSGAGWLPSDAAPARSRADASGRRDLQNQTSVAKGDCAMMFVSRRELLGGLLVGVGALVSACGASPTKNIAGASADESGQVSSAGGAIAPVAAKSPGADPLAAV